MTTENPISNNGLEVHILPVLYSKTETGGIQSWTVAVHPNGDAADIRTRWGLIDGAQQESSDTIKEGKNVGKKNETTPYQQALKEAKSLWEKKLKKGYVKTVAEAEAGKVDAVIKGGIEPMLAHKFADHGDKIQYPVFVQPKLDGHRCVAVVVDGKATLWSRTRKPITGVPHIVKAVEQAARDALITNAVLDGELYSHSYRDRFEELSSFIRQVDPKPGHEVVEYHIYDFAGPIPQWRRFNILEDLFSDFVRPEFPLSLRPVETRKVHDREQLDAAFADFIEQGYEGLMVRTTNGMYENKRSKNLLKMKEFDDAEFKVKAVEEGRGKLAGKAIFVCEHNGQEFRVKMKGTLESLKKYIENPELAVDKWLTVRFFGFTAYGLPRFPVGIRFRPEGE